MHWLQVTAAGWHTRLGGTRGWVAHPPKLVDEARSTQHARRWRSGRETAPIAFARGMPLHPSLALKGVPVRVRAGLFVRGSTRRDEPGGSAVVPVQQKAARQEVCNPHSVFGIPLHRPARSSSPHSTGRVQGRQPMLR